MNLSPLRRLVVPLALLVAAIFLEYVVETPAQIQAILEWLPYVSLVTALILSGYHGYSRLFAATAALLIIYYLVINTLQVSLEESAPLRIYSLISLIFPVQILFLLLVPERRLWNRHGLIVVGSVPVFFLTGLAVFFFVGEADLLQWIEEWLQVRPFAGYVLSANASLLVVSILLLGIYRLLVIDSEQEAALSMITGLMYLLLVLFNWRGISDVTFSLMGITLFVAMIRSVYELAFVDELTNLPGRRAFNDRLKSLGKNYVIAMVDVDHFKKFNDTHGHDTGDDILKMVAKRLGEVGGGGTAYRYGGEEFCIVFSGKADAESCKPYLEEVRMAIENYQMIVRDQKHRDVSPEVVAERRGRRSSIRNAKTVSVTVSIGVASAADVGGTPEEVMKAADKALYDAKEKGRNRLVAA